MDGGIIFEGNKMITKFELYTIGHSTHSIGEFIKLLTMHSITAVCDVRSTPYSQFTPQFNRELLQKEQKIHNISYVFLGEELGARSDNPSCYVNGKVQYGFLAQEPRFYQGINRLVEGLTNYRIALMCAEKDPIACHRTILVCRNLRSRDIEIKHILGDGKIESNIDFEQRLLDMLKIRENDLFTSNEDLIEQAYNIQGQKIAYVKNSYEDDNKNSGTISKKAGTGRG